jgi:hypothetical protein
MSLACVGLGGVHGAICGREEDADAIIVCMW